eukprot:Cvel_15212.t1-p1 / transcript=Cvel_15212.t1 / gene=Cvel_15212 / organism=Chromera_velia_CCMP2878 / gene_product=hypothetical protein / transcript_product=hypothetical protein / location=Cvel_scaffold1113:1-485(-) / protein_length=161 / sequence_SO=supercontig / SO=protein_coding / is_pseudo=false
MAAESVEEAMETDEGPITALILALEEKSAPPEEKKDGVLKLFDSLQSKMTNSFSVLFENLLSSTMRRPEYGAREAPKEIPGHWVTRGRAFFDLCKDEFNEFHDSLNWLSYRLCVSNGLKYFALKYRVLSLATYQTDILTGFLGPHYVWERVVLGLGEVDAS